MSEFQAWSSTHPTIRAGDWNALLDHGLEKPASYIIRKNGNYYEAINGSTGKIDYGGANNAGGVSGSDAATVMQQVIDNGKTIFIKEADYYISKTINCYEYTTLIFENRDTKLYTDKAITMIKFTAPAGSLGINNSKGIFGGKFDGDGIANIIEVDDVEEFWIFGSLLTNFVSGIELKSYVAWAEKARIDAIKFMNFSDYAIKFTTDTSGGGTGGHAKPTIIDCRFEPSSGGGGFIYVDADSSANSLVMLNSDGYIRSNDAIVIDGETKYWHIINPRFEDKTGGTANVINASATATGNIKTIRPAITNLDQYVTTGSLTIEVETADRVYLKKGYHKYFIGLEGDTSFRFAGNDNMLDGNWVFAVRDDLTNNNDLLVIKHGGNVEVGNASKGEVYTLSRLRPSILKLPLSAPASPKTGDAYFDSATDTLYIYNGTAWVSVTLT